MADAQADLMALGQHCSLPDCQQLDFLPFKCDSCNKVFCLDHRSYGAHACTVAPASRQLLVIVCPVCAASVHLKPGEDPNAAYERHARAGVCDPRNYQRVHQKPRCPARGCKEKLTSINTYSCKACRQQVCMRHRHADDHQCPGRPTSTGAANSLRQSLTPAVQSAAAAAASVGSHAMDLMGRFGRTAAAAAGRGSAAARDDPSNTVRGTAERRRQLLQQQQGTGGQRAAAAAQQQQQQQRQRGDPVIDLTRDEEFTNPLQQQQQQRQQVPQQRAAGGPASEFACHKCGMGFDDPVALIEHDARCGTAAAAAAGGANSTSTSRATSCRVS